MKYKKAIVEAHQAVGPDMMKGCGSHDHDAGKGNHIITVVSSLFVQGANQISIDCLFEILFVFLGTLVGRTWV